VSEGRFQALSAIFTTVSSWFEKSASSPVEKSATLRAIVASLIGASKPSHIKDAIASLGRELSDEEIASLEEPRTPRHDFPCVSNSRELAMLAARLGIAPA
jgi:hypothetical protein